MWFSLGITRTLEALKHYHRLTDAHIDGSGSRFGPESLPALLSIVYTEGTNALLPPPPLKYPLSPLLRGPSLPSSLEAQLLSLSLLLSPPPSPADLAALSWSINYVFLGISIGVSLSTAQDSSRLLGFLVLWDYV